MESLDVYSEIFIGLAGFSGVVAALDVGKKNKWSSVDKNRFVLLIGSSFFGIFFSLFPQIIQQYVVDQKSSWQLALGLIGSCMLIALLAVGYLFWRTKTFKHPQFSKTFMSIGGAVCFTYSGAAILAAVDIHFEASFGIYAIGLLCVMLISAGMFGLLVKMIVNNA
jgi:hypothetical protein